MHRRTVSFFFFQAEDGIRDLVRSRGLGDVYKRQARVGGAQVDADDRPGRLDLLGWLQVDEARLRLRSVSYTHLTLPTSDLV